MDQTVNLETAMGLICKDHWNQRPSLCYKCNIYDTRYRYLCCGCFFINCYQIISLFYCFTVYMSKNVIINLYLHKDDTCNKFRNIVPVSTQHWSSIGVTCNSSKYLLFCLLYWYHLTLYTRMKAHGKNISAWCLVQRTGCTR